MRMVVITPTDETKKAMASGWEPVRKNQGARSQTNSGPE